MKASYFGFVAVLALGAAACSSSSSNPPAGVTVEQACTDWATKYCGKLNDCAPLVLTLSYGSAAACQEAIKPNCLTALADPNVNLTPTIASTCAAGIGTMACSDLGTSNTGCPATPGKVAEAGACGDNAECQSNLCDIVSGTSCGKCSKPKGAGDDCTANGKCSEGYACAAGKCAKPGATGATCGDAAPCGFGLVCAAGKCAVGGKLGEACSGDGKTDPPCNSLAGLWCNPVAKKCEAIKVAALATACGIDMKTYTITTCDATGWCDTAGSSTGAGTCKAKAKEGEACGDKAASCVAPLNCEAGKCAKFNPTACK